MKEALRHVGEQLDLPQELLPGFSHVELWQNRQAVIEGVKGVLHYSAGDVRLNLGDLVLHIRGDGLCIRSYQMERLCLVGEVLELSFGT